MNQQELEKHLFFHIAFYVFLAFTIGFTIFWLLTDNVEASDIHYVVTSYVQTDSNQDWCSSNQSGLCVANSSSPSYSRYVFGNTISPIVGFHFRLNYRIDNNVNATIRLTGRNWANVNYTCSGFSFVTNCRVVRASSTILNVNFTNVSNAVTGETFTISANGNVLNSVSSFYVEKVDLYETYLETDSTNQDIINNQNQNTEDIINSQNSNTQDINNNMTNNFTNLIDKGVSNMLAQLNQDRTQLTKMCTNAYDTPLKIGMTLSTADGSLIARANSYYTEDYINIDFISGTKTRLYIENPPNSVSGYILVAYDSNKNYLGRVNTATRSWSFPSGTVYFRFSSPVPNTLITANTKCVTAEGVINDYLQDDSNPTVDNSGIQNTISSVNQTNPLQYFLTLPTTLINATITGLSSNSCTDWKIGRFGTIGRHDLSGYEFKFPCVNIRDKIGDNIYLIIDAFVAIGILVGTVVKLYHTVSNYITLGAEDEVRAQSSFLSPMDFLGNVLGGNAGGVISHLKE